MSLSGDFFCSEFRVRGHIVGELAFTSPLNPLYDSMRISFPPSLDGVQEYQPRSQFHSCSYLLQI